jgi:hypothetical protein
VLFVEDGQAYLGTTPSKERLQRICEAISAETGRNKTPMDAKEVVQTLSRMSTGWANYFCLGPVGRAYRAVDQHTRKRLRQWLCIKHKVRWPGKNDSRRRPSTKCLVWSVLPNGPRAFRGRKRELSPSAGCGKSARPVR